MPEEETDRRSIIEAAIKGESEGEATPDEPVETQPSGANAPVNPGDGGGDAGADPAGTAGVEADPQAGAGGGEPVPEGSPSEPAEPAASALDAPAHWPLDHQELFRKQPPEVQQFLIDRHKGMEADYTRKTQEIAPLRNAVQQWEPYLQQLQATPDQMFSTLLQTEYGLRTGTPEQKAEIILNLARNYGVSIPEPGSEPQPNAEEDPFGLDQKVQQAVAPLTQQVQQMFGGMQQQAYQQQLAAANAAQQQIDEFKNAKGADGKPAHPYFDEVEKDMEYLVQARGNTGQPPDLAELYETACWANPSVRAKLQAAEKHAQQVAERKAEQERAERARTAAGSLAGGGGGDPSQPRSRREAIQAAIASQQAAA